ncbi:MAG TPA: AmiS/UreI family transporter [Chloroflexota bacterium]
MAGLMLLYVGAVLFLNGLWILDRIQDREIAIINLFVGGLGLVVALSSALQGFVQGQAESVLFGAQVLLFAFTYLWVAYNRFAGVDGRGLGWFCLFVALTALPIAVSTLANAGGRVWPIWLGINWAAWAVLWFMFFLLLALQRPIKTATGVVTILQGVLTAWIPGYLLLTGVLR